MAKRKLKVFAPKYFHNAWSQIRFKKKMGIVEFSKGLHIGSIGGERFDLERYPYMIEPLKAATEGEYRRVIMVKSAQVGFTTGMMASVCYKLKEDPSMVMVALDQSDTQKKFAKMRMNPMLEKSPIMQDIMQLDKQKTGDNTLFNKITKLGSTLTMINSGSRGAVRSLPINYMAADEVSNWKDDEASGKVLEKFENRGISDPSSVLFAGSTPLDFNRNIHRLFLQGTQEAWNIECPNCGVWSPFVFEGLRYEHGVPVDEPLEVRYECPEEGCAHQTSEIETKRLLQIGKYVAANDKINIDIPCRSFYVWCGQNPALTFSYIVRKYQSYQDSDNMQSFENEFLGRPYAFAKIRRRDYKELRTKCIDYPLSRVPQSVAFLCMGVDVGSEVMHCSVWGYAQRNTRYLIDYFEIKGSESMWDGLREALDKRYMIDGTDGLNLRIQATAIDKGYKGDEVQEFVIDPALSRKNVYAVMGRGDTEAIYTPKYLDEKKSRNCYYNSGVNRIKRYLFYTLIGEKYGRRQTFISKYVSDEFLKHLSNEEEVVKKVGGKIKRMFELIGSRPNHYLDSCAYAECCSQIFSGKGVQGMNSNKVLRYLRRQLESQKGGMAYLKKIRPRLEKNDLKIDKEYEDKILDRFQTGK